MKSDQKRFKYNLKDKIYVNINQNYPKKKKIKQEKEGELRMANIGDKIDNLYKFLNDEKKTDKNSPFKRTRKSLISAEAIENIQRNFSEKLGVILESLFNTHVMSEAREIVKSNPFILGDLILKDAIKSPIMKSLNDVMRICKIRDLKLKDLIIVKEIDNEDVDLNDFFTTDENIGGDNRSVVYTFADLVSSRMRAIRTISKTGVSKNYISFSGQNALFREYRLILLKFKRLKRKNGIVVFTSGSKRCYNNMNRFNDRYENCNVDMNNLMKGLNPIIQRMIDINTSAKESKKKIKFNP